MKAQNNNVVYVTTNSIRPNPNKMGIYGTPENFEKIKENISRMGVLVPLFVDEKTNEIISGNLRYQIALELNIEFVPVIFQNYSKDMNAKVAISTNQYRKITSLETLNEIKFFEECYPTKKGQRIDLNPVLKEMKVNREVLLRDISKDKQNKLKSIDKLANELFGRGTQKYLNVFRSIDNGLKSLNKVQNELNRKVRTNRNVNVIPKVYDLQRENVTINCSKSEDMSAVEDNSIQTIITSPPYFNMRDYLTGDKQIGLESNVNDFINNLMVVFKEAYRVLKPEGSLFVNINDCCIDGKYQAVPQKFVIQMMKLGFLFNDEFVWVKNNAQYTQGNRSVRNHEPIFHFVKTKNTYYDTEWMNDLVDENNAISCGTTSGYPKLWSGLDYLLKDVIRGNSSTTKELRKECLKEGFYLTHTATFPLSIPAIYILMTSKEGDTVLDCFSGTATTGEAALMLGRKYIGYDNNPEYVKASEVRLKPYLQEEHLLAA